MTTAHVPTFVQTDAGLLEAVAALEGAQRWAIDTEFMRVDTYFPQLCLLQIASEEHTFCIDPIAVPDLSALDVALQNPHCLKVMHAARQDLEVLAVHGGHQLNALADTQVAAALLGLPEQVGYAWLVEHYRGVVLDKSQTRTDWARRPLTDAQWRYAAQDVEWLLSVWDEMAAALATQGKLAWLKEDCLRVPADENQPVWQRMKGIAQFAGAPLAVAQAVCKWREAVAREVNRPRTWILRDETVLAFARSLPHSVSELARLPGMPPATVRRYGEVLLQLGSEAAARGPTGEPMLVVRLSGAQSAQLTRVQEMIRLRAIELCVAPTLLASRRDLERLLCGQPVPKLTEGWRAGELGAALSVLQEASTDNG